MKKVLIWISTVLGLFAGIALAIFIINWSISKGLILSRMEIHAIEDNPF